LCGFFDVVDRGGVLGAGNAELGSSFDGPALDVLGFALKSEYIWDGDSILGGGTRRHLPLDEYQKILNGLLTSIEDVEPTTRLAIMGLILSAI
jgi:hypothetical protein